MRHLFILQTNVLEPANHPGVLFCQHNTDQQHNQPQANNTAAREPAGVEQRVGAVMFENDSRHDKYQ